MQNNDIVTRLKAAAAAERIFFTEGFTTPGGQLLEESGEEIQKLRAQLADAEKRANEAEAVTDTFCRMADEALKIAKIIRSPELEKLVNDANAEAETHYSFKCKKTAKIELEAVLTSRKERIIDTPRKFVSDRHMTEDATVKSYDIPSGLFFYVLERPEFNGAEVWTREVLINGRAAEHADFAAFFTSVEAAEDHCKTQGKRVLKSRHLIEVNPEPVAAAPKRNVDKFFKALANVDHAIQSADVTPLSDAVLKLTDALRQFAVQTQAVRQS